MQHVRCTAISHLTAIMQRNKRTLTLSPRSTVSSPSSSPTNPAHGGVGSEGVHAAGKVAGQQSASSAPCMLRHTGCRPAANRQDRNQPSAPHWRPAAAARTGDNAALRALDAAGRVGDGACKACGAIWCWTAGRMLCVIAARPANGNPRAAQELLGCTLAGHDAPNPNIPAYLLRTGLSRRTRRRCWLC